MRLFRAHRSLPGEERDVVGLLEKVGVGPEQGLQPRAQLCATLVRQRLGMREGCRRDESDEGRMFGQSKGQAVIGRKQFRADDFTSALKSYSYSVASHSGCAPSSLPS